MKKNSFAVLKNKIWFFIFIFILCALVLVGYGSLVRHEILAKNSKFPILSKAALFLAEMPMKLQKMTREDFHSLVAREQRFSDFSGFQGEPLQEEIYLLHSRYDRNLQRSVVELVDLRSFSVKKTWSPDINQIIDLLDLSRPRFKDLKNTNVKNYRIYSPFLTDDGGLIFESGGSPLIRIDKNSDVVWTNQKTNFHHSQEQDFEGNFWVPSYQFPYQLDKKYVGSDFGNFKDKSITKVSPEGKILFQKSVTEIFMENNMENIIFQHDARGFNSDPTHLSDIEPVLTDSNYWKRGDVFLSLRHQSMIILYRPSTNQIIWKSDGNIFSQFDVNILDNHRIYIFNNNLKEFYDGYRVDESNEVIIYDFETDTYSKYLNDSLIKNEVKAKIGGRTQILHNGDLFIEETDYGRNLYFNKDGSLQWQYINRSNDGVLYRLNWSRILHKPKDINKVLKILNL